MVGTGFTSTVAETLMSGQNRPLKSSEKLPLLTLCAKIFYISQQTLIKLGNILIM